MQHYQPRNAQTDSEGKNTKKAAKRKKLRTPSNNMDGMRQPSIVSQIYRKPNRFNEAVIADASTEKRLSRYGPPTSTRLAGYNYIW